MPAILGAWSARRLTEGPRTGGGRFDVTAAVLGSAAVAGLCLALIEFGRAGGRIVVVAVALVAAAAAAAAFWPLERPAERPVVDVALFRDRRYAALMVACAGYNGVIAGEAFLLSLLLQSGRGSGAAGAGLVLFAATVLMPVGSQITGRLVARPGLRLLMAGAAAAVAVALVATGAAAGGSLVTVAAVLSLAGLAGGMLFAGTPWRCCIS